MSFIIAINEESVKWIELQGWQQPDWAKLWTENQILGYNWKIAALIKFDKKRYQQSCGKN